MNMLLEDKYYFIVRKLIEENKTISTMESCTGGFIASMITDVPGASNVMKCSFVTYSNEAKIKQGVPEWVIDKHGVYSKETAYMMAHACARQYNSNIGIGITGCFGSTDPQNKDGVPGVVDIAIVDGVYSDIWTKAIGPFGSRHDYKIAVADFISDELMKYLGIA